MFFGGKWVEEGFWWGGEVISRGFWGGFWGDCVMVFGDGV